MDSGGSMDYEYESAVRHGPHHHYAVRTGRGCPALAGQQSWNRSDWLQQDPVHTPWHPMPLYPPPGLTAAQHWAPPEPTYRSTPLEMRSSNPAHSHDAVPHSTPAYSPQHSPASASASASAPASAPAPVNPPELSSDSQASPSPTQTTAQAMHAQSPPDEETRHSGSSPLSVHNVYNSPPVANGAPINSSVGETTHLPRRHQVSTPAARIGLPALSVPSYSLAESRARHRMLSEFHRPRGAERSRSGNTSASPTSSVDDDSDPEIGQRMQMFGLMNSARQTQILRGQMPNKRVASRKALASLQKVDLDSLADSEKMCVICYNDYGVASPEGTVETPLRLPKCKHVFGDNCIRKWLEDSYSCPYCRDKLDSELAQPSEQFFHRMLASSGSQYVPHVPVIRRILGNTRNELGAPERGERLQAAARRHRDLEASHTGTSSRDSMTRGERRAAPSEDSNDAQRRQRPRHETLSTSRPSSFSYSTIQTARPSPPAPVDPVPMQSPMREASSQRTPAWHHGQQTETSRPPLAPQFSTQAPAFHFPRITHTTPTYLPGNVPFIMPPLPQPSSAVSNQIPPMQPREDFYAAPPMIRDGGWYNSNAGPASGSMLSSTEPQFPYIGSNPTTVTSGSGVYMPPLAHSTYYPGHVPHGIPSGQPQPQYPDRSGNLPNGSHYMS